MKKIIAAWIEQILEFPSESEYQAYVEDLKQRKQRFHVVKKEILKSGIMLIRIRKQYNNNAFPDEEG
mgnify:CR=1 FL=1